MLKKIDHINIVVENIDLVVKFFKDIGLEEVANGYLEGDWLNNTVGLKNAKANYIALTIPNTETKIEIIKYLTPKGALVVDSKANDMGYRHIAFEVEDIEIEVEKLRGKDIKLFSNIQIYPKNGKKLVYFYGPENIIIEYAQYTKN